jgi:dolichyl-diphosphooligosaccharide--protein glycosyltransferase
MQLLQQAQINPQKVFKTAPSWVKTFERVPGATVTGTGPANTTITAQVRMSPTEQNGSFVYRQQAETGPDGEFTMTLPYSTTGYENWGTENGYTNVSVRAQGQYQLYSPQNFEDGNLTYWNASTDVTEAQVIGESDESATVELTRQSIPLQQQTQSGNNSTAPANETDSTNETAPANETDAGNDTDSSGNDSSNSSALAAPSADAVTQNPTPADALPERDATTPARAGLVGAWAAALFVAKRD